MYYLSELCCICVKHRKKMSQFSDVDSNNITYYTKLISVLPELNKKTMNHFKQLCGECSQHLEIVYNFRTRCLNNIAIFEHYLTQLRSCSNVSGELNVVLDDLKNNNDKVYDGQHTMEHCNDVEYGNVDQGCEVRDDDSKAVVHTLVNLEEVNFKDAVTLEITPHNKSCQKNEKMYECLMENENTVGHSMDNLAETHFNSFIKSEIILDNIKCEEESDEESTEIDMHFAENTESNDQTEISEYGHSSHLEDHLEITLEENSNESCIYEKSPQPDITPMHMEPPTENELCYQMFTVIDTIQEHKNQNLEKTFECAMCNKNFSSNGSLVRHLRTHTGEKPYECKICKKKFRCSKSLTDHLRIHTGEKPYECEICYRRFTQKTHLTQHMRTHTGEKPYQCKICKKRFTNNYLSIHLRTHTGEKPYECEVCKKRFNRSNNLKEHLRLHTGERPFHCNVCNKTFASNEKLKIHVWSHTGETPFFCDLCNKSFTRKWKLKRHNETHHAYLEELGEVKQESQSVLPDS